MRKIYEAPGMMEWHPEIAVGRSRVKISFEGGHFSGHGQTPAVFETSNPAVQAMIEKSALFRAGRIRLGACIKRAPVLMATECPRGPEQFKEKEFDNIEMARDYLILDMKIPASKVMNLDDCMKEAAKIGINLKIKS